MTRSFSQECTVQSPARQPRYQPNCDPEVRTHERRALKNPPVTNDQQGSAHVPQANFPLGPSPDVTQQNVTSGFARVSPTYP